MKLYMTAGHQIINGKGNGAFGVDGFDEAVEARKLVNDVINWMTYSNRVQKSNILTDNDSWSLRAVIDWLKRKVTRECFSIDFHFNAFSNPRATGTEVLVANDRTQLEFSIARDISFTISKVLKIKNRGVKKESESARKKLGMLSGGASHAINVLVEVCFITNEKDVRAYRIHYWKLVEELANIFTKLIETK